MIALLALAGAATCAVSAVLLLRRVGSGYRIARVLAAAPEATLAEIRDAAERGDGRYVRAAGRVSSEEEFPDENERPLVFRRQRIQVAVGRTWKTMDEERLAVPFGLEDRREFLAVDADALGDGLVVMPRESVGIAAELPEPFRSRLPAGLPADARVRLRIDQISAVEHATVAGVPLAGPGGPMISAGAGRPLIVSTLEPAAAMRLLAGDHRRSVGLAAAALVGCGACLLLTVVAVATGR